MNDKKASNLKLKSVPVELDKKRNLRFDMNAFAYLEETFGSIQEALSQLQTGKIKAVLEVLKAGLLHEDETLTTREIGKSIGLNDIAPLARSINEAMGLSLPDLEEGTGKNV